jgi:hypothetical protein
MSRAWLRSAIVVVVCISALGLASHSSAATLSALGAFYVIDDGAGNLLFEQEHFFFVPRFDPGFGTLDALTITVTRGAVVATISVDNESPVNAAVFSDDVSAVAFIEVSYSGGSLAESDVSVDIGPSPGVFLPPDSDGAPDFVGSDALAFSGLIPGDFLSQSVTDAATLADFTGVGSRLIALTISELGGSTIPGAHGLQASYGQGIGAISLAYEYTPAEAPTVPEPGTLGLLAVGLVAWRARRPVGRSLIRTTRWSVQPPSERELP